MTSQRGLLACLIAAVSLVAAALFWDEQREFEHAVKDLTEEQVTLATAVAADVETRLARLDEAGHLSDASHTDSTLAQLLGGAMKLERHRARLLLVALPDEDLLLQTNGRQVESKTLLAAMRSGVSGVVLDRFEAAQLGLPPRIALAGIETIRRKGGRWGVVVLMSGERLRARERYAQLRFLLSLGLVTAIVAWLGGVAIRQQRRELEVARALEVSALQRERERLLAKADKMATLAALSSGIAHEVATPLSTILARVEQVLPSVAADARASAALHVSIEQVERIQAIIRGVLGLARGEMPPLVRTGPRKIVAAAADLSSHRFAQAGVTLELDIEELLPDISCDPPMLEQALTNLLLNACDASASGNTVRLSARTSVAALCLVVEDEGEGISPETAARANEPFFTTKPRGRGNGLGLAITREIVSHHGGQLRLEPRSTGRGTRGVIELPQL